MVHGVRRLMEEQRQQYSTLYHQDDYRQLFKTDLKLPLDPLEKLYRLWVDNPWKASQLKKKRQTYASKPFACLSISQGDTVKDYTQLISMHVLNDLLQVM